MMYKFNLSVGDAKVSRVVKSSVALTKLLGLKLKDAMLPVLLYL